MVTGVIVASLIAGIVITAVLFIYVMRNHMVADITVDGDFESVNRAIKSAVPKFDGWSFPITTWEFYKSQLSKNLTYDNIRNMVIHFVCKPSHANKMLQLVPSMGGIMPCSWAVYETTDGKVHIAKMNINLMSKMYSGTIKEIMTDVAQTEKAMLSKIEQQLKNGNIRTKDSDKTDEQDRELVSVG